MFEVIAFIISAIAWFFLPAFRLPVAAPADDVIPIDNINEQVDKTPSVFIDKNLLPFSRKSYANCETEFQRQYTIDGVPFQETFEIERYRHFELYANNKMDDFNNSGKSLNEDSFLQLYIQNVPNGVIINANVYLTHAQWNTLVSVSDTTLSCTLCGVYCEEASHIQTDIHKTNLDRYKPLEKYDLSIIRKIDNYYHCAVCNMVFHQSKNDDHFSSKEHEGNMLFAVNKVSDIMYDMSIHTDNNIETKKDIYHYNARAINNMEDIDDVSSESDVEYCDYDKLYGVKYSDEEDEENFYDNVDPPLNLEHSYASMARKPKSDELPDVLDIDLGNKKVTVKFDSWNMVISPKPNRFYCMVCTQFDHIRRKAEHCRSEEHTHRLDQCKVIEMYDKYLVRQVDDKLYHCGHCNNLQLINEMEDHIESQHPVRSHDSPAKRPATPLKRQPKQAIPPETVKNERTEVRDDTQAKAVHATMQATTNVLDGSGKPLAKDRLQMTTVGNMSSLNMYHDLRSANSNIDEDIVICAYGFKIAISKLAFNIVCGKDDNFYCGLCEVSINRISVKGHVNDLQHLILLQRTPFIEAFNIHLYRQIRDALHCGFCNELIQLVPDMIIRHKIEAKHLINLGRALKYNKFNNDTVNGINKTINTNIPNNKLDVNATKDVKPAITAKVNTVIPNVEEIAPIKNPVDVKTAPKIQAETAEFIEVRNGVKDVFEDTSEEELDDSMTDAPFDIEEYIYVKLGSTYIKITNTSYNTLVEIGDGTKYCFVCSIVVSVDLKKHVDSRAHMENLEKYKFVDKYKQDLLRQMYLMYHCGICNVLITRKQVNHHLTWPTHALQTEYTKINSKQRKSEIKSGVKQITVNTQKENIYLNENETKVKIVLNVTVQKGNGVSVARKNKIVIFNDNVLKIPFDSWHSVTPVLNGWKCKMCQCDFDGNEFANHVSSDWHKVNLDKIDKVYSPALIRKINDLTLNCIMCNTEVSNKPHIVHEHIQGKKHLKNYDAILKESSVANSYADCDEDVLMI